MLASLRRAIAIGETAWLVCLRCLIVDDNTDFLRVVSMLLAGEGIEVVGVATSSAAALTRVDELQPDVVLVDIKLGDECGFVLTKELVERFDSAVIIVSTYAERDFADLFASSPALGFISKSALTGDAIRELVASSA